MMKQAVLKVQLFLTAVTMAVWQQCQRLSIFEVILEITWTFLPSFGNFAPLLFRPYDVYFASLLCGVVCASIFVSHFIHKTQDKSLPTTPTNSGNTCYLNATLQCLKTVPELRDALKKYDGNALSALGEFTLIYWLITWSVVFNEYFWRAWFTEIPSYIRYFCESY